MKALVLNIKKGWDSDKGFELTEVTKPDLTNDEDVIIKVHYTGVCGTDKGLWNRVSFRDQIVTTLEEEKKDFRIVGHEIFGEVSQLSEKAAKKFHLKKGDFISCESHLVCNKCFQCKNGQKNVCINEKILGISHDGGFAEYIKVPGHIVWKTDTDKIRAEVAVLQEPFGNAVHCASKVSLKGKTVLISGLGPIGLFLVTIAKAQGAKLIIGIDPNPVSCQMAEKLGIDFVINPKDSPQPPLYQRGGVKEKGSSSLPKRRTGGVHFEHDPNILEQVLKATSGQGVDVSFEMSGFNNSLNNCIFSTRRGGEVVLFGIKSADFIIEDYNRLIVRGLTLHAVIGREVWGTWEVTRRLLEDRGNKIQDKLYNVILNRGEGTILQISDFTKEKFEDMMTKHPKFIVQF